MTRNLSVESSKQRETSDERWMRKKQIICIRSRVVSSCKGVEDRFKVVWNGKDERDGEVK